MIMKKMKKQSAVKLADMRMAVFLLAALLPGCAPKQAKPDPAPETVTTRPAVQSGGETAARQDETDSFCETTDFKAAAETEAPLGDLPLSTTLHPEWASFFDGVNGAAVIFDRAEHTFEVYNENLADTRRPPCSTFKIISSLAGLESGVIDPENSVRPWSGERFWNDDWNRDMDFDSAFHTSCVWYYRQVIDEIGPEAMQDAVEVIGYGNCDLSDWEGRLNTNNSNPALTGFWIESSLKISPREQTEVLERIFGGDSEYTADVRAALEEVMFLSEASDETCAIYGKTGMGKANGVVADCWYAGFADVGRRIYFCIYLGETDSANVSSALAREIAVSLIKEYVS